MTDSDMQKDMDEKSMNIEDFFDQTHTYSHVDDLLADPFDEASSSPTNQFQSELEEAALKAQKQVTNEKLIDRLPQHRQGQARDLAKKINENDMAAILVYGANAQKKLGDFSHQILQQVQVKDTGEIGDSLVELMQYLQESNPKDLSAQPNMFTKLFKKVKNSLTDTQIRYQKIGSQIDRVAIRLERERNELMNDNRILEQFYEKNKDYFEALNIYIAAGEVKMDQLLNETIPSAIEQAKTSQSQMDIQKVNDLSQFLDRLDKRTHDLRLTRQMTLQQAPQIRMIQNTNQALAEKIQVSIHTAIPLWENQITIALALLRQQGAANSQRMVSETTNNLLLKNSEMLHQSSTDIAREVERGVIDLETLQKSQQNLIKTIEDTLQIQQSGFAQRRAAEEELSAMEAELRNKLLDISRIQTNQKSQQFSENKADQYDF
ncbi:toxic anion resistance protein [Eremococcus coleocola]|uniref:Toxic anion resistance protein TelA n=1 Tax=Eremococcus coleocola ACS-139-V-Col8 TaxID=908337 RepID=E4KP57_9LACT|nr:toxic anion resistance protein TelA [Eremococcus coleocola ACS-139-V-Col8]